MTRSTVRLEALEEIAKIGRYVPKQDEKELRGELSTILEHELPNAIHDDRLLPGVAGGLATVGTAAGVESLLKALGASLQEQDYEIIADALLTSPLFRLHIQVSPSERGRFFVHQV